MWGGYVGLPHMYHACMPFSRWYCMVSSLYWCVRVFIVQEWELAIKISRSIVNKVLKRTSRPISCRWFHCLCICLLSISCSLLRLQPLHVVRSLVLARAFMAAVNCRSTPAPGSVTIITGEKNHSACCRSESLQSGKSKYSQCSTTVRQKGCVRVWFPRLSPVFTTPAGRLLDRAGAERTLIAKSVRASRWLRRVR